MSNRSFPESLIRPQISRIMGYNPMEPLEGFSARVGLLPGRVVKLDANENPYGPSPRVREALASLERYHLYPDPQQSLLRQALGRYVGASADQVMAGNGSDELIELVSRLFLEPGDGILDCPPSFGMYAFAASIQGARVLRVPRRADFSLDVEEIERTFEGDAGNTLDRPKLLFLASPNNPDGSVTPGDDLRRLLALSVVVVLDEAYAEFAGESNVGLVSEYPNLIVLRTFSKWAGLAGLRLGYGIFPPGIIAHLWKIKPPFNISVAAQAAALASLEDAAYLKAGVQRIVEERERLSQALARFDFLRPYPSRANFLLCRVVGRKVEHLRCALEEQGILVRYFTHPELADCIRISVGRPQDTRSLLAALERFQAAGT
ncbi:MAG: histidinol-phosphate transaminase [Chloroflexota bacterium]